MTDLTITGGQGIIRWVKVLAAQHGTSGYKGGWRKMLKLETYQVAMMRYLARPPVELKASEGYAIRHARRSTAPGRRAGDFSRYE